MSRKGRFGRRVLGRLLIRSGAPLTFLSILLLVWQATADGGAPREIDRAFVEGNRLYGEGRYPDALAAYRLVLARGYHSPELFLNLGNAAYQAGEPGWAAYYYELARRRAPGDPDIRSNLAQARRQALGEEPSVRSSVLLDRLVSLQDRITVTTGVWVAVAFLWIATAAVLLSWLKARGVWARRFQGTALAAALLAVGLLGAKMGQTSLSPEALVVRPVSAHTEPSENATVEFRLPPGSPVQIGRRAPGWCEIIVSSSLRGWVVDAEVAAFKDPR